METATSLKLTVVTPSFNQSAYIEEALLSVKGQNYPALQHIVIDGASTDTTVETLARYASTPGWEHLGWISEPDAGQSHALNKGFKMATGDIIGWLNSDDRYRPGCFETIGAAFQEHPEVDLVYGDYTWIDEKGCVWQVRREIEFSRFILLHHRVLYIPSTATFFRRRILDEGNLIDIRYHYAMDYEFFVRLAEKGYRFKHIPHLLADFRWHSLSKSASQAAKQLQEHDHIAQTYSPILKRLPEGLRKRLTFGGLRAVAAALRYSEKLLRGYYFSQFRPSTLLKG